MCNARRLFHFLTFFYRLKWKPPELNTVDFRIAARWSKEHKPIYSIEVLSHGVTYKFYDHFQPEPALATEYSAFKQKMEIFTDCCVL